MRCRIWSSRGRVPSSMSRYERDGCIQGDDCIPMRCIEHGMAWTRCIGCGGRFRLSTTSSCRYLNSTLASHPRQCNYTQTNIATPQQHPSTNDDHDVPPPHSHPSKPVYTVASAFEDATTINPPNLAHEVPSDPQSTYTSLRTPPLPSVPRPAVPGVPNSPRAITAARGTSSGGIFLIFCHVGRNLSRISLRGTRPSRH
jgi:hypothetical protein